MWLMLLPAYRRLYARCLELEQSKDAPSLPVAPPIPELLTQYRETILHETPFAGGIVPDSHWLSPALTGTPE